MAFIFSTSHLPDLERSAEEEEDDMKPMPRAGGVRAFSHLPQPVRAQADASPLWGRGMAPLPPRSASPTSPAPSDLRDQDDPPPPEAGLDDAPDAAQEPEDSRPWYMPRLSAKDLLPQGHDEDTPEPSLNGPALKPWEKPARSSGFDGTQPEGRSTTSPRSSGFSPSPQDLRDAFQSPAPGSPVGQTPAQDNRTALLGGRLFEQRSAPAAFLMQKMGKTASGLSQQQRLQGSPQALAAQPQPVLGTTPPADGNNPAAPGQAVSPYQGEAPNTGDGGRAASPQNTPEIKDTRALRPLRPGKSPDPGEPISIERDKIEEEMTKLLLARRAVYDKKDLGNMPISTDELTRLMELDYQRGLAANTDGWGMTFIELMFNADDAHLYHTEPNEKKHPGYEGNRGSGFELEESPKPRYDNPHIIPMIRGKSDPYFSWEINCNVVGQWLRIAGYNKIEAAHFLAAWLAKSPSKWKSLDLDRQTWFWIGYDYANARQRGWHPAGRTPGPKPGNYWWLTPPPASYPSKPQERRRF